jgi:hypothetical protein
MLVSNTYGGTYPAAAPGQPTAYDFMLSEMRRTPTMFVFKETADGLDLRWFEKSPNVTQHIPAGTKSVDGQAVSYPAQDWNQCQEDANMWAGRGYTVVPC